MKFREYIKEQLGYISEDHFDKGEKVLCPKSGKVGKVVSSTGEGDNEVYTVDFDGEKMEKKPSELKKYTEEK